MVKEAALRRSMAPVKDETGEERALPTRVELINYIRFLGDDCLAIDHDTYDSTVA